MLFLGKDLDEDFSWLFLSLGDLLPLLSSRSCLQPWRKVLDAVWVKSWNYSLQYSSSILFWMAKEMDSVSSKMCFQLR